MPKRRPPKKLEFPKEKLRSHASPNVASGSEKNHPLIYVRPPEGAFPASPFSSPGMTLRDYATLQILPHFVQRIIELSVSRGVEPDDAQLDIWTVAAFRLADSFLRVRKGQKVAQ